MKRSCFKSKLPERRPAKQIDYAQASTGRSAACHGRAASHRLNAQQGIKAKPGSAHPAAESHG